MDTNQQKAILKAQIRILIELGDRAEETTWIDAWIDLKAKLIQELRKLEA